MVSAVSSSLAGFRALMLPALLPQLLVQGCEEVPYLDRRTGVIAFMLSSRYRPNQSIDEQHSAAGSSLSHLIELRRRSAQLVGNLCESRRMVDPQVHHGVTVGELCVGREGPGPRRDGSDRFIAARASVHEAIQLGYCPRP